MNGTEGTADSFGDQSVRSDVDALRNDLSRIKEDLATLASSMRDTARSRAYQAKDEAQARVQQNLDSFEHYVEEKPLTTVLVAFGVGLVLGTIFSR